MYSCMIPLREQFVVQFIYVKYYILSIVSKLSQHDKYVTMLYTGICNLHVKERRDVFLNIH